MINANQGESQYGPWNLYGVEYDGEQQGVFADEHCISSCNSMEKVQN